jgi:hypothetical protein
MKHRTRAWPRSFAQQLLVALHGFEAELDEHVQRGRLGGWRVEGLSWEPLQPECGAAT